LSMALIINERSLIMEGKEKYIVVIEAYDKQLAKVVVISLMAMS